MNEHIKDYLEIQILKYERDPNRQYLLDYDNRKKLGELI